MVGQKITRTCVQCGTKRRTSPFYCSRQCVYDAQRSSAPRRFFQRITKTPTCWLWRGPFNSRGYGKFWLGSKTLGAHRFAYELMVGPIPVGLSVMHQCDVPSCVNPEHLSVGTTLDNVRDKWAKGRGPTGPRASTERMCRGIDQWAAKLTEDDVRHIREERAAGATLASIAKRFDMTPEGISAVCRRHTWKHVE
jgi:Autographiviridae HNH endonuclease